MNLHEIIHIIYFPEQYSEEKVLLAVQEYFLMTGKIANRVIPLNEDQ